MEKTLSMGAFTELSEREVMETEGGALEWLFAIPIAGVVGMAGLGVACLVENKKAEKAADAANASANAFVSMVDEAVMSGKNVPLSSIALADQYRN